MNNFTKAAAPDCFACKFSAACFFYSLDAAARKDWNGLRTASFFTDGQNVYSEYQKPQGIFIVCKGRTKVFSTDARGSQLITWIRHPGEFFGHIALFSENDYLCNGRTMGATTLSFVNAKDMARFLKSYPKTYTLLLRLFANEMRAIQLKLKDTAYKPASAKVAMALINAVSYKSKNTSAPAIHGLKRTEIAELTGLALETVVRAMAELEKKKVIKRETKAVKILDYAALLKLAGNKS